MPAKDEPKIPLTYTLLGNDDEQEPKFSKVEAQGSLKIKQLKKIIHSELGIKEKINIRIFSNGQEVSDDNLSIKDSGILENGGNIEVDLTIKISVEVLGKGKGY